MEDDSNQTSESIPEPDEDPILEPDQDPFQFGIAGLFKLTFAVALALGVLTVLWMKIFFSALIVIGLLLFVWMFLVPQEGKPW
jgi:Flp pilus assembly protein TadB